IRGYKIRLPLDVLLVASANPEDYTNRGRMITPLKDRFGAQIRTHYPIDIETEMEIARQESELPDDDNIVVPEFMEELISTFTHLARSSPQINQRSGVSVRLTVANMETLVAAATRRSLRLGETEIVPRVSDLDALISSTAGKIEIESLEEGRDGEVIDHLLRGAILTVFKERFSGEGVRQVVDAFEEDVTANAGDDLPVSAYTDLLAKTPALAAPVAELVGDDGSDGVKASAVELLLEGLHLSKRLNKDSVGGRASYRARA
ncbi:MAG: magnesium chelatase, partial [Acidimicrobiales bacterium]